MLDTPILFLIFNRPDTSEKVFEVIKQIQPKYFYIAADGPREGNTEDIIKCENTRKYVLNNINWDCEVKTLFQEKNLGCGKGVSSAITWFFENVEEGIILEDDCFPDISFFSFCEELLMRYKKNEKIMLISGYNLFERNQKRTSYIFSRLVTIWGWATWKRAWQKFDYNMKDWPQYKGLKDIDYFGTQSTNVKNVFDNQYKNNIDTWDAQWAFAVVLNCGLSIVPCKSLISNIGFNQDATHTLTSNNPMAKIISSEVKLPLKHPKYIKPIRKFDIIFLTIMNGKMPNRINLIKRTLIFLFKKWNKK